MVIYKRENNEDKNIEAIIPDEIKNAPQTGCVDAIDSINNILSDIIVSETKNSLISITTMKRIINFIENEFGDVPEILINGNQDPEFIKRSVFRCLDQRRSLCMSVFQAAS